MLEGSGAVRGKVTLRQTRTDEFFFFFFNSLSFLAMVEKRKGDSFQRQLSFTADILSIYLISIVIVRLYP